MQKAIELRVNGLTLRGMEHMPDTANADNAVPAAILFHGYTGTHIEPHRLFVKISRALEAVGIAAFRFDFTGSGDSDGDFEEMTASGEIRDAKAILAMVKADPRIRSEAVNLIGLSMGGFIAGVTAGDMPGDVDKLVLLAAAGNFRDLVGYARQHLGVDANASVYDDNGNLVGRCLYDDVIHIDGFERAKPFQGPVLLVHGTNDASVPYEVSLQYQREVYGDRAELHLMEGADHTFNNHVWECEVISHIVSFLA